MAVKVLAPGLAASVSADRFLREIETTARLVHPHIVPLHDSGEREGVLYYVMPFVTGETLRVKLAREGRLSVEEAVQFASEVADALVYAHAQNLVHRDLKPENILISEGHADRLPQQLPRRPGDADPQAAGKSDRLDLPWHRYVAAIRSVLGSGPMRRPAPRRRTHSPEEPMRPFVRVLALNTILFAAAAFSAAAAAPEGWFLAGLDRKSYSMDLDDKVAHEGKSSARFASRQKPTGFGTMMQSMEPGDYLGKRVRYSAFVKTKDVTDWAGLWMRVDGPSQKMLAFDNMSGRPIKGTMDWTRHEIVLDVGAEATGISFGILMDGTGTTWLDDVKFEVVDNSVPVTEKKPNKKPANLNLER